MGFKYEIKPGDPSSIHHIIDQKGPETLEADRCYLETSGGEKPSEVDVMRRSLERQWEAMKPKS